MAARKGRALRARLCVKTLDAKRRALAAIHAFLSRGSKAWVAGPSPAMTKRDRNSHFLQRSRKREKGRAIVFPSTQLQASKS
jgi:hypothetical protein